GYGEEGSFAEMKAYDLLVQAESGLCSVTGRAEGPGRVGVSACDISCGMYSYMAVLEALIDRETTGVGTSIKTSLFAGMADWMNVPLLTYDYSGKVPERVGLNHPSIAPYGAYPTSDGGEVLISIQNEREWGRLCSEVLGRPEMSKDPKFLDNEARCKNRVQLDDILHEVFTAIPHKDLLEKLRYAAIAFGEVNGVEGLSKHPALKRVKVDSPTGPLEMVAPPATIDGEQRELGPVPDIGQHSEQIRKEFAG
ncbi:MAG: CaiB/BaiF CoA-transferase family protein, partial [Rhodospirillales bacterium]